MSDIFDEISRKAVTDESARCGEWPWLEEASAEHILTVFADAFRKYFTAHPEDIARALPDDYFGRDRPFIRRDDLMLVLRVPTPRDPPH